MANGYTKIAGGMQSGRLSSTASQSSLWQGPDHLVQAERDGYTESYRRFYFSDIEIVTVRLDTRRRNIAIIFGAIIGVLAIIAVLANNAIGSGIFFGIAGVFLIPFIYNLVRGPSCVVHIATAVQREELKSVRRVKGAMRLLQVIRDAAAQTQGLLAPDMVRVKFELQNAGMSPAGAPPSQPAAEPAPAPAPQPEPIQPIAPPESPPTQ